MPGEEVGQVALSGSKVPPDLRRDFLRFHLGKFQGEPQKAPLPPGLCGRLLHGGLLSGALRLVCPERIVLCPDAVIVQTLLGQGDDLIAAHRAHFIQMLQRKPVRFRLCLRRCILSSGVLPVSVFAAVCCCVLLRDVVPVRSDRLIGLAAQRGAVVVREDYALIVFVHRALLSIHRNGRPRRAAPTVLFQSACRGDSRIARAPPPYFPSPFAFSSSTASVMILGMGRPIRPQFSMMLSSSFTQKAITRASLM